MVMTHGGRGMVRFRVLGPLECQAGDRAVQVGGKRQRRLLAVLLLNTGRPVSFERLADELWATPPQSVQRQVYNAASALRAAMRAEGGDCDCVETSPNGYQIRLCPGSLDADDFRERMRDADRAVRGGRLTEAVTHLNDALGLWRGPALAGLTGPLITSAAAVLDEQRSEALERLYALRLTLGEGPGLVVDLMQLVAEQPLREPLRASLMLALYQSGRQAEALAVYDEGRRHLVDSLGLDPGAELRQVHDHVLRGEPGLPGVALPNALPPVAAPPGAVRTPRRPAGTSASPARPLRQERPELQDLRGRTDLRGAALLAEVERLSQANECLSASVEELRSLVLQLARTVDRATAAPFAALPRLTGAGRSGEPAADLPGQRRGGQPLTAVTRPVRQA